MLVIGSFMKKSAKFEWKCEARSTWMIALLIFLSLLQWQFVLLVLYSGQMSMGLSGIQWDNTVSLVLVERHAKYNHLCACMLDGYGGGGCYQMTLVRLTGQSMELEHCTPHAFARNDASRRWVVGEGAANDGFETRGEKEQYSNGVQPVSAKWHSVSRLAMNNPLIKCLLVILRWFCLVLFGRLDHRVGHWNELHTYGRCYEDVFFVCCTSRLSICLSRRRHSIWDVLYNVHTVCLWSITQTNERMFCLSLLSGHQQCRQTRAQIQRAQEFLNQTNK